MGEGAEKKAAPIAPVQASGKAGITAADDVVKTQRAAAAAEAKRIAAVTTAAAKFPEIQASAIEQGWTVEKTELEVLRKDRPTAPAGHIRNIEASGLVLEAALCNTMGHKDVEKRFEPKVLEAAHRDYRNLSLQGLLMIAACANGYAGRVGERIHNGNVHDVLLHALPGRMVKAGFSTVNLPGIFSNVANKELLLGYTEEDQTWREIAQVKRVNDFKAATSYRLLDNMEYEEVPAGGKIPHGTVGEESYTRQAKTYAKMFSLTRQDIINDDLGAFDDLRTRLGRGAAKKLNNVFWTEFMDNSTFYTAARANYITGATTTLLVDGVGLQAALLAFMKLRSPVEDGSKRVGDNFGGRAEILLVPPELSFAADRLYQSTNVNTGGSSTAESVGNANIHARKYRPVVCNWLSDTNFTGNSSTAWYLFRNPRVLAPVVVSFLNGQETPTVESAEADFNELGIQFRGFHDFGCDSADYLAGIKSKGAA
jgi:phage major head subunit gpT-like protein